MMSTLILACACVVSLFMMEHFFNYGVWEHLGSFMNGIHDEAAVKIFILAGASIASLVTSIICMIFFCRKMKQQKQHDFANAQLDGLEPEIKINTGSTQFEEAGYSESEVATGFGGTTTVTEEKTAPKNNDLSDTGSTSGTESTSVGPTPIHVVDENDLEIMGSETAESSLLGEEAFMGRWVGDDYSIGNETAKNVFQTWQENYPDEGKDGEHADELRLALGKEFKPNFVGVVFEGCFATEKKEKTECSDSTERRRLVANNTESDVTIISLYVLIAPLLLFGIVLAWIFRSSLKSRCQREQVRDSFGFLPEEQRTSLNACELNV